MKILARPDELPEKVKRLIRLMNNYGSRVPRAMEAERIRCGRCGNALITSIYTMITAGNFYIGSSTGLIVYPVSCCFCHNQFEHWPGLTEDYLKGELEKEKEKHPNEIPWDKRLLV